jgi:diguanylate cyclase (GGDEF)-like protein
MTNIGITYVDINNLHEINRIYGHEAGDDVIMNVSKLIRFYYTGSKIFRIDGDEFVIVTSGYTKPKFKELSELSKIAFEEEHLAALGSKFYAEIKDFDECIKECRERMAEHKSKMKQNLKGVNA